MEALGDKGVSQSVSQTDKIAYKSLDKTFLNFNTAAREKLEKLQKVIF